MDIWYILLRINLVFASQKTSRSDWSYFKNFIILLLLAIWNLTKLMICYPETFIGQRWILLWRNLLPVVMNVRGIRVTTSFLLDYCNLCLFLPEIGNKFRWIWSRDSKLLIWSSGRMMISQSHDPKGQLWLDVYILKKFFDFIF